MSDAPPSYEDATGAGASSMHAPRHIARNGIPPERRRSMEDELRPLPEGWIRRFDDKSQHQFFVDTRADPPRSIWRHPYDDDEYLNSLSREEREHIMRLHRSVSLADIEAESSDDEGHGQDPVAGASASASKMAGASSGTAKADASGGQQEGDEQVRGLHKFGRRLKDKITNSTHAEREEARQRRAEQERRAYQLHVQAREAMSRALETGEPQYLCKDNDGKDIYILPPNAPYGYGPGVGVPAGAMGYNPYASGPYGGGGANSRYFRPDYPYSRPYGYGYGGGYGFPLLGGLVGGALLGSLLF